jgi:hypothetical protein
VYLAVEMVAVALACCVVLYAVLSVVGPRRLRFLQNERRDDDPAAFLEYFGSRGVPQEVAERVRRHIGKIIGEHTGDDDLHLRPTDRLCKEWGICGYEDVTDLIAELTGADLAEVELIREGPEDGAAHTVAELVAAVHRIEQILHDREDSR